MIPLLLFACLLSLACAPRANAGALPAVAEGGHGSSHAQADTAALQSVYEPFRDAWVVRVPTPSAYQSAVSAFVPQLCVDDARCAEDTVAHARSVLGDCAAVHRFVALGPWASEHVPRERAPDGGEPCPAYLRDLQASAAALARATAVPFCEFEAPASLVVHNARGQLERWSRTTADGWELRVRLVRVTAAGNSDAHGTQLFSAHATAVVLQLQRPQQALSTVLVTHRCAAVGLRAPPLSLLELVDGTCVWRCRAGTLRSPWNAPPPSAATVRERVCRPFPTSFSAAEFAMDVVLAAPATARPGQELLAALDALADSIEHAVVARQAMVALQVPGTPHAEPFGAVVREAAAVAELERGEHRVETVAVRREHTAEYGGLLRVEGLLVTEAVGKQAAQPAAVTRRVQRALDVAVLQNALSLENLQVRNITHVAAHAVQEVRPVRAERARVDALSLVLVLVLGGVVTVAGAMAGH